MYFLEIFYFIIFFPQLAGEHILDYLKSHVWTAQPSSLLSSDLGMEDAGHTDVSVSCLCFQAVRPDLVSSPLSLLHRDFNCVKMLSRGRDSSSSASCRNTMSLKIPPRGQFPVRSSGAGLLRRLYDNDGNTLLLAHSPRGQLPCSVR